MLLTAHDTSRPAESTVSDGFFTGHVVLHHQKGADHGTRAAQAGLAVNSHRLRTGVENKRELKDLVDYTQSREQTVQSGNPPSGK